MAVLKSHIALKNLIVDDESLVISERIGFLEDEPYDVFTEKNRVKIR